MALQPCPIVGSFLHEVELFMGARPNYYDDLVDELDELKGLASENYPNESALRLRGLYALEVMYSSLLPAAAKTVPFITESSQRTLMKLEFPRSVEGMQMLVSCLNVLKEDTEVAGYAAELGGLGVDGVLEWGRGLHSKWCVILNAIMSSASQVELALRGAHSSVRWELVGSWFAVACLQVPIPIEGCFNHARVLLRINLQNGPQPWNLTKNCLE